MKLTGQGNSKINTQGSSNGRPAIETTPLSEGMNGMIVEDPEYFNVTKTTPDIAIDKLEAAIAEKGKNDNEGFRKEYAVKVKVYHRMCYKRTHLMKKKCCSVFEK